MKRFCATLMMWLPLAAATAEPLSKPVLERYEQMLLASPGQGTAFDKIYQHYLETDGFETLAARWREAAEKGDSGKGKYLLLLGLLDERRGKTEEALKEFQEAVDSGAGWAGWAALAGLQAKSGKLAPAIASYKKAVEASPPKDALSKLYRGLALCQQRQMDFTGAVETWEAYAEASPDDPYVLEEAGDALFEADRYAEAKKMFGRLRELPDIDPSRKMNASLRLAEVEREQGDKNAALKIYDAALAEAGEASWLQREVRARIERLFRSDDDLPGLTVYYEKRLQANPGDLEALLRLSETYGELNRADDALNALKAAANKAPDRKDVQLKLVAALLQREQPGDALTVLGALVKKHPDDAEIITLTGEAEWQSFKLGKGSKETAIATWKKLAPDASDANAVQRLAEIFRNHDLKDETVAEYRRALALDPSANDRRERLAEYLMEADRKEEAFAELQGIVEGDRASGENYLRLAKIQRRFGDDKAARKSLEAAAKYEDRAFERAFLLWQLASDAKAWDEAESLSRQMREKASADPEIDRADECLVDTLRELKKSDAEIARLLDGQKKLPAAFTERDWRLLFTLALAAGDDRTADFAVSEGLKQFPKSAMLSKLENAYARRTNNLERRLASLERLEKIEPQRAGDWMIERARALREAGRWDEAVQLARDIVALLPAKVESQLLLADTYLAAQRQEEAVKALQEAVRLSDNPNQIRLRLADLQMASGNYSAARSAVEEAFEAEESVAGKLRLTGRLASAYLEDGKVDDLISKLKARQKAEEGGWRYAMYLAEVYLMMQDSVRAMEELDKALAGKPDDPVLLKRLLSLAEGNGDTEAALRYARKIAEVEPSKQNRAQLGEALARDGKLDEALSLVRDNSAEFLENPSDWQDVVQALQAEDKTGELASMLEAKLKASPDDWKSLMALAEILMGAGQTEKAEELLWRVLALTENTASQPQATPAPVQAPAPPVTYNSGRVIQVFGRGTLVVQGGGVVRSGGGGPQTRQMRFNESYQKALQMLASGRNDSLRLRRMRMGYAGAPQRSGSASLEQARDDAIVYLACIATRDTREEGFLQKLSASLADRPLEDRIEIYNMLQAPEPVLEEVEAELRKGELDPKAVNVAYNAIQIILNNRRNNPAFRGATISEERLKAAAEKLGEQMKATVQPQNAFQRYHMLNTLGKTAEAENLVKQIFADLDLNDSGQVATAMQFALMRRDFDRALDLRGKLAELRKKSGQSRQFGQDYSLAMALLGSETHKDKAFELLAEEFMTAGTGLKTPGAGVIRQISWPQLRNGSVAQFLPLPTAELDQQRISMLRSLGMNSNIARKALPDLAKRFQAVAEERKSASLKQAVIFLHWFSGDQKTAVAEMKVLLDEKPSDDLALNYALMLFEMKKPEEALKALDLVQAGSGDIADVTARLRMVLALQAKDDEAAKAAALKLQSIRLVDNEQQELVQEMRRLGLTAEADRLVKKKVAGRIPGQRTRQMAEIMRERMESGERDEALAIASALLSRDPFSSAVRNERYQQDQALRTLKKYGELDTYIARLKEQIADAPESARLNALLAMASSVKDPASAEPYYRKLSELRPKDPEWLLQYCYVLMQAEQYEEAMRIYDRLLAENPSALFMQGANFMEPYRRTKSWQRLADAVAKSPDPKVDPLNPYRQNFSHVFLQVGRELQRARPPVDPIDVWLKGLQWDEGGSTQLRPMLAQALVRAGRTDEARKLIEDAFFPPGRDESSARLFVYNRQFRPNVIWGQLSTYSNGEIESTALRLMRTANALGVLGELLPRLDKLPVTGDGVNPGIIARVVLRDPSVLGEVKKVVAAARDLKAGKPNPGNLTANGLRILAGELADWPAGRDLAYQCLDAAVPLTQLNGVDITAAMGIQLRRVSMAVEDRKTDVVVSALKGWSEAQRQWMRQGASPDFLISLNILKKMVATGMDQEAKELTELLKTDRNYLQNSDYQRRLQQLENEISVSSGRAGNVSAVLAWTPEENGGRLVWDLRPAGSSEEEERAIWMSEEPLKKLAGKYTLEVYFGASENTMKRLFSRSAAPTRSEWTGKLPASRGYLRAILRQGDEMMIGPSIPVMSGKRLVGPEVLDAVPEAKGGTAKGWASIPPVSSTIQKGGPTGSGTFLRLDGDRQNEMELTGERVAVDPRKNYLLGCWFRYQQNDGQTRIGWRAYDSNGKEIGNYQANASLQGDRWNYALQRFGRGNNSYSLPEKTAWLESYVVFSGQCDLSGMFMTELEPEAGE